MKPFKTEPERRKAQETWRVPWQSRIIVRTAVFSWALVMGTLALFVSINIPYQKKTIQEGMDSEARNIATSIDQVTATAIVTEDYGAVVEHCMRVVKDSTSIVYVVVTRKDGFSLISRVKGWEQKTLGPFWNPPQSRSPSSGFSTNELAPGEVFHHSYPFQYSGIDWGWIHVGISLRKYHQDLWNMYQQTTLLAVSCILLALIPSVYFARKLSNPIRQLDAATQRVARGDLTARSDVETGDELENLSFSFNRMTEALEKSQGELLSTQAYTDNIIKSMNDTLVVINLQGMIKTVNYAACGLLGYREVELVGAPLQKILGNGKSGIGILSTPGSPSLTIPPRELNKQETYYFSKGGNKIPVLFSAAAMHGKGGEMEGWVCVAVDITERKKVEEELKTAKERAEEASRAKSDFLANMSHELRTPLNHIIGFTELVADGNAGELNEMQAEYLGDVLTSSRHLLSLINDILDLSKVEAGKLELEASDVALPALLQNSLTMIKEKAMKHGIRLQMEIDGIPEQIRGDERKLKQILYNLLSNAVKFTPDGGVVSLAAGRLFFQDSQWRGEDGGVEPVPFAATGPGEWVKISVRDTGIGLKGEDLERIFAPFEQADNSASRRFQGTGLGLSLTRRLVELHGGQIWAESDGEGKGSDFKFLIPVQSPGQAMKNLNRSLFEKVFAEIPPGIPASPFLREKGSLRGIR